MPLQVLTTRLIRRCLGLCSTLLAFTLMSPGAVSAASSLAAGWAHTCAADMESGQIHCWGWGERGQLGENRTLNRSAPVPVAFDQRLYGLSSLGGHTCGVSIEGGLFCWGDNARGQLGDGTTLYRTTPTLVTGLASGVTQVSVGWEHTCARLATGAVKCWGASNEGRLGTGHTSDQTEPRDVLALTGAVAVAAGEAHSCALIAGGQMRCWGRNSSGQVGDGTWVTRTIPVVIDPGMSVVAIDAGVSHTCALGASGAMRCWGYNGNGQLGDGTNSSRNVAVNVDGLGSGVARISTGGYHSCAVRSDQSLRCWGYNGYGQLGVGSNSDHNRPQLVASLSGPLQAISAGHEHTCIRRDGNDVRCWGRASQGRIGFGTPNNIGTALSPVRVGGLANELRQLSLFWDSTCGVTQSNDAVCWGRNYYGQLGDGWQFSGGEGIDQAQASQVAGLAGLTTMVAVGREHACATTTDGSVWCWGHNNRGQVGDGTAITRRTPVRVADIGDAIAVAAGWQHNCVLRAGGSVACWGLNNYGQLGDGSLEDRSTPVPVVGLTQGVVEIVVGADHNCARMESGQVKCWGHNWYGQIGDGSHTDRHIPTDIDDPGVSYAGLSAGWRHTCGHTSAGQARCWGSNGEGQLGDGSWNTRNRPAAVDGLLTAVSQIAAGAYHTCAVRNADELKCWGYNGYRQLGDGTTITRNLPVNVVPQVGTVGSLALGEAQSCVVLENGRGRCWGYDGDGRLGNGTVGYVWNEQQEIARWTRTDVIFRNGFER